MLAANEATIHARCRRDEAARAKHQPCELLRLWEGDAHHEARHLEEALQAPLHAIHDPCTTRQHMECAGVKDTPQSTLVQSQSSIGASPASGAPTGPLILQPSSIPGLPSHSDSRAPIGLAGLV
jgi:hypothetical protein